jgi:hypothetical protein
MVDCRKDGSGPPPRASAAEISTFANDVHVYLRQNVTWADQKAGFVFASSSAVLAYLHSKGWFEFLRGRSSMRPGQVALAVGSGCLLAALGACLATYWPRRKGRPDGVVFWGAIARESFSAGDYVSRVRERTADDLADEKLRHAFELARICDAKFRLVDVATRFAAIGFALSLSYVLLLA